MFYGPSGTGKTHLLHAIGNQLRTQGWRVQRYYAEYLVNLVLSPEDAKRIDLDVSQPASCEVLILSATAAWHSTAKPGTHAVAPLARLTHFPWERVPPNSGTQEADVRLPQ